MLTWVTAWNSRTFSVSLCLHLHPFLAILSPSSSLCIWICFSFPWVKEVFFCFVFLNIRIYTQFQAHWVTLRSYFMRMTGLLPVCASLCVYCLWMEMKRGSAARLGTTGGMLAGTAGVALPNAHTQRSHQNKQTSVQLRTLLPPTLFQRVINLLFFPLLVIFLCALRDEYDFHFVPFCCNFLLIPVFPNIYIASASPSSFLTFVSSHLLLPSLLPIPFSTPLMPIS